MTLTLPAAMILSDIESVMVRRHIADLGSLVVSTPATSADAEAETLVIVTKMLLALPGQRSTDTGNEAKGEAYLAALDDVPPWAVQEAVRKWYRGEHGSKFDYRWSPVPADLRSLARNEEFKVRGRMTVLERIVKAEALIEYSDDHREMMLKRLQIVIHDAASITKPEDLKGKTVAVSRVCDSTCFQISRALVGWGMSPKDVSFLGVTDYTGMFASLRSGQISAAALAPPFNFEAKKQGFHSLADLSQLPIEYPTAVVQTVKPFLTAHPDTAVAFLRAYVKAIQRYKSDEAFMVDVYKRFLKSDDTQVIQDTWSYYRNLLHDDPTPTVEGVKFVLDTLAETGPDSAKSGNPPDFIAPQYIQQAKAK